MRETVQGMCDGLHLKSWFPSTAGLEEWEGRVDFSLERKA